MDPAFAMAGSDPVDGGSHLAEYTSSVGPCRRIEICWLNPAAASPHRTLSETITPGLPRCAISAVNSRTTRLAQFPHQPVGGSVEDKAHLVGIG